MKNKFQTIQPWIAFVLSSIKRDIKVEHLVKMPAFYKEHFGNRPLNRLTNEEILAVYEKALLQSDDEDLSEWIVNRWVFHHGEIYQYFSEALSRIQSDFNQIQSLTDLQSRQILEGAIPSFGALNTYLFSVLNEVVFPENILKELRSQVEKETSSQEASGGKQQPEEIKAHYEKEILRLHKKCEDKILGVMKKHANDVEALKKQIRALQKQLNAR